METPSRENVYIYISSDQGPFFSQARSLLPRDLIENFCLVVGMVRVTYVHRMADINSLPLRAAQQPEVSVCFEGCRG